MFTYKLYDIIKVRNRTAVESVEKVITKGLDILTICEHMQVQYINFCKRFLIFQIFEKLENIKVFISYIFILGPESKKFECKVCGKKFIQIGTIKRHCETHDIPPEGIDSMIIRNDHLSIVS